MQNKYSKKQIEELYNCEIFKDSDLGLWVAQAVQFTDDEDDCFFVQATGHDVDELHENIRKKIRNHAYFKGYNAAIDEFEGKLLEYAQKNYADELELGGRSSYLCAMQVKKIAEQMKAGE